MTRAFGKGQARGRIGSPPGALGRWGRPADPGFLEGGPSAASGPARLMGRQPHLLVPEVTLCPGELCVVCA